MDGTGTLTDRQFRVMFGGDVMLGRLVGNAIRQFGAQYPLGPIAPLMSSADLAVVNLECAITDSMQRWSGAPKAFYFGAPPEALQSLTGAGIDIVSLANNHVLDFDIAGMQDTLHALHQGGILHAGSGSDLRAALRPAIIERQGMRFGMAAFCDHQADFAAGPLSPGIAYLDLHEEDVALAEMRGALDALRACAIDWPILSLHWGPNMVPRPSAAFRRLAHAAVDMGWKILFGHSAHVFHGIELYHGCPILYAAGDLVDDYRVDAEFRNDHQLLIELQLSGTRLDGIAIHPVFIDDCRARLASGAAADYIVSTMTDRCREFGTAVRHDAGETWIELA